MKPFRILKILVNRDGILSTMWSFIQQIVVAASTYLILQAIRHATANEVDLAVRYILGFVASLILVYVPNSISLVYLDRWRLSSFEKYVEAFIAHNQRQPTVGHSRNKTKAEAWLTNESLNIFDQVTNLLYQIFATLMNSGFNILVLAFALDPRLLGWYLLSGVFLISANYIFKGKIATVALDTQKTRNDLANTMLSAWDNIFIGNRYNLQNWNARFHKSLTRAKDSTTSYVVARSLVSSIAVSFALLIIATGNGIYFFENRGNITATAALLITLPRQLQILQSIFALFGMALNWSGSCQQLKEIESVVRIGETTAPSHSFVRLESLELSGDGEKAEISAIDDFVKAVGVRHNGRWTLRGRNGTGKSTLLSLFTEHAGENAFLLPSNYIDLCFKKDFLNHSDGNRLLSVFSEIRGMEDIRYVVLDEWDANLDRDNIVRVDQEIENLSRHKVILESRHRV